jgi:hypothetical protein
MFLRFGAISSALLLLVSQTSQGLFSLSAELQQGLAQVQRQLHGHYTDRPGKAYRGIVPGRAPLTRGGLYSGHNDDQGSAGP